MAAAGCPPAVFCLLGAWAIGREVRRTRPPLWRILFALCSWARRCRSPACGARSSGAASLRVPLAARARRVGALLFLRRVADVLGHVEAAVLERFRAPQRRAQARPPRAGICVAAAEKRAVAAAAAVAGRDARDRPARAGCRLASGAAGAAPGSAPTRPGGTRRSDRGGGSLGALRAVRARCGGAGQLAALAGAGMCARLAFHLVAARLGPDRSWLGLPALRRRGRPIQVGRRAARALPRGPGADSDCGAERVFWARDAALKRWKAWLDAPAAPERAVGLRVWRPRMACLRPPAVGTRSACAAGNRRGLPWRLSAASASLRHVCIACSAAAAVGAIGLGFGSSIRAFQCCWAAELLPIPPSWGGGGRGVGGGGGRRRCLRRC